MEPTARRTRRSRAEEINDLVELIRGQQSPLAGFVVIGILCFAAGVVIGALLF